MYIHNTTNKHSHSPVAVRTIVSMNIKSLMDYLWEDQRPIIVQIVNHFYQHIEK